jgi:hypothetical protein
MTSNNVLNSINDSDIEKIYVDVNEKLIQYALAIPPYVVNIPLLSEFHILLNSDPIDLDQIQIKIMRIVMSHDMRAGIIETRLEVINIFKEFGYYLDHAYLSFCRGNYAGTLFTLLPIIEGMLRRWAKNVNYEISHKSVYKAFIIFIRSRRDELQSDDCKAYKNTYVKIWIKACCNILDQYLFSSDNGEIYDGFNRHEILHQKRTTGYLDRQLASNVQRAFLIIDLLLEIYVSTENINVDPFYEIKNKTRLKAYCDALKELISQNTPENIINTLYTVNPSKNL